MARSWESAFNERMQKLQHSLSLPRNSVPVSVKVRAMTPCYDRGCCPHAYAIIDRELEKLGAKSESIVFLEHETGPEILTYVMATTAGVTFATGIINLVTAIIKARFKGAEEGDNHDGPIELIVRRTVKRGEVQEETVLRFSRGDRIVHKLIANQLPIATERLLKPPKSAEVHSPKAKRHVGTRKTK